MAFQRARINDGFETGLPSASLGTLAISLSHSSASLPNAGQVCVGVDRLTIAMMRQNTADGEQQRGPDRKCQANLLPREFFAELSASRRSPMCTSAMPNPWKYALGDDQASIFVQFFLPRAIQWVAPSNLLLF